MILYLGIESALEGTQATTDISTWVQQKVINDETTRRIFNEQMNNGKMMISSGLNQIENDYNETIW